MWYRFIRLICLSFFRMRCLNIAIHSSMTYLSSLSLPDTKIWMALMRPFLAIWEFVASSGNTSRSFTGSSNACKTLVQQYPLKSLFLLHWMQLSLDTNLPSMGVFLMKPRSRRSMIGQSARTLPRFMDSLVYVVYYAFLSVISLISLTLWFI